MSKPEIVSSEEGWKLILQKLQDIQRIVNEDKINTDTRFDDIVVRLKILQQTPVPASTKKNPTCRKCGVELMWPKPYIRGSHTPPVNLDGSQHVCPEGFGP